MEMTPIGIAHTRIKDGLDMPLEGVVAKIEVSPGFKQALYRIEENSHLWILSWFHYAQREVLQVVPMKINPNADKFGVFAVRSPVRPNPIALTLVKLEKKEGNVLYVSGYDGVDGTPILDIKPYIEKDIVREIITPKIGTRKE